MGGCDGATLAHATMLAGVVTVLVLVLMVLDVWVWTARDVREGCAVQLDTGDVRDLLVPLSDATATAAEQQLAATLSALFDELLFESQTALIGEALCGSEGSSAKTIGAECSSSDLLPLPSHRVASSEAAFVPTAAAARGAASGSSSSSAAADYALADAWRTLAQVGVLVGSSTSNMYSPSGRRSTSSSPSTAAAATRAPYHRYWRANNTLLQIVSSVSPSTDDDAAAAAGDDDGVAVLRSCVDYAAVQQLADLADAGDRVGASVLLDSWAAAPRTFPSQWAATGGLPRARCEQASPGEPLLIDAVTVMDALGVTPADANPAFTEAVMRAATTGGAGTGGGVGARVFERELFAAVTAAAAAAAGAGGSSSSSSSSSFHPPSSSYMMTGLCVSLDVVVPVDRRWPYGWPFNAPQALNSDSASSDDDDDDTPARVASAVFSQIPCALGVPPFDRRTWRASSASSSSEVAERGVSLVTSCEVDSSYLALWTHLLALCGLLLALALAAHALLREQTVRDCCWYNSVRACVRYSSVLRVSAV
jgi:hypothetical protein